MVRFCAGNQSTRIGEDKTFLPGSSSSSERSFCSLQFSRGATSTSCGTRTKKNIGTDAGVSAVVLIDQNVCNGNSTFPITAFIRTYAQELTTRRYIIAPASRVLVERTKCPADG